MNRTLTPLAVLAAKASIGASLALGFALAPHAHPDDVNAQLDLNGTSYVNLSELPAIDSMPVCQMEDGSDVAPSSLPCVWTNQGNSWLTFEDHSLLIVDDTVRWSPAPRAPLAFGSGALCCVWVAARRKA